MSIKTTDTLKVAELLTRASELQQLMAEASHPTVPGGYSVGVFTSGLGDKEPETFEVTVDGDLLVQLASDQIVRVKAALAAHGIELADEA